MMKCVGIFLLSSCATADVRRNPGFLQPSNNPAKTGQKKEASKTTPELPENYYDMFDLNSDATNAEIEKAFRKKSLLYHPDKHPNDPTAEGKFQDLEYAKAVLLDKNRRRDYDEKLKNVKWKCPICMNVVQDDQKVTYCTRGHHTCADCAARLDHTEFVDQSTGMSEIKQDRCPFCRGPAKRPEDRDPAEQLAVQVAYAKTNGEAMEGVTYFYTSPLFCDHDNDVEMEDATNDNVVWIDDEEMEDVSQ